LLSGSDHRVIRKWPVLAIIYRISRHVMFPREVYTIFMEDLLPESDLDDALLKFRVFRRLIKNCLRPECVLDIPVLDEFPI
jgi:hypothetical protein